MSRPRRMTAVRISEDGLAEVQKLAAETGATKSEIMRLAFSEGLLHRAAVKKKALALVASVNAARAARGRPPR